VTKKPRKYGLSKNHTRKNAREFVDFDYVEKLSDEEREFLERFSREFYQGGPRKGDPNAVHATDEQRKATYRANNERNRDVWNKFQRLPLDMSDCVVDPDSEDEPK
jgi:hypothetical protein